MSTIRSRADAYRNAVETRVEVYRDFLYTQLMEGRPDNDPDDRIECSYVNVSDIDLNAAIEATTMDREEYLECERIAGEEADFVARKELKGMLAAFDKKERRRKA